MGGGRRSRKPARRGQHQCGRAQHHPPCRAVLTTELEQLEVRFATAGEASADDLDLYSRASANLRRLLESVGLQRRARDVRHKRS